MQAGNAAKQAELVPKGYELQKDEIDARNFENGANLVLQAARLGLDIVKTVEDIKTQNYIRDQESYSGEYQKVWADKISRGLQPFSEVDGEMRYTQFQELQELGKSYVESVQKKYGKKMAERAQAFVDGRNIDDYFSAAKLLNRDAVELTETNSRLMASKAVDAGNFGVYDEWLGTVTDEYKRSRLRPVALEAFNYGMTLKSAKSVFDSEGISAATQYINGTAHTSEQKEALIADVGRYESGQVSMAVNEAANAFNSAMESGGGISAAMTAAENAAARVTGSPEARRSVEQNLASRQSKLLGDSFYERLIPNESNAAWLEGEARRLRAMKGDAGDYRGQSSLRESHIRELESRARSIRNAERSAEAAAARESDGANREDARMAADALLSRYYEWERGADNPGDGKLLLRDMIEFGGVLGEKQNTYIENLVLGKDKAYGQVKYAALTGVLKAANVDPQRQTEILEAVRQARLDGAKPEQMDRMIDGFNRVETSKFLSKITAGKTLKSDDAVKIVEAANAGDLDAYIYSRSDTAGGSKEKWIGGDALRGAMASLQEDLRGLADEAGLDIKTVEMAKDSDGDSDGYYIATDKDGNKYRLGVTARFLGRKKLGLEKWDEKNKAWVLYKMPAKNNTPLAGYVSSFNKMGTGR